MRWRPAGRAPVRGVAKPTSKEREAGTARRLRGALAHLRPVVPAPTGAVLTGETICTVMTVMALRTCSTVKMMLVTQVRGRDPPDTRTLRLGLRTEQDLKVSAIDEDAAF